MIDIAKRIGEARLELAAIQAEVLKLKSKLETFSNEIKYKVILGAGGIKELGPNLESQNLALNHHLNNDDEFCDTTEALLVSQVQEMILQANLENLLDERRELEWNEDMTSVAERFNLLEKGE